MQTILITGGNSGLGYETAKKFLQQNYQVIITCRSQQKIDETIEKLKNETGINTISGIVAEFNSLKSINSAMKTLKTPINILVCNAGIAYETLPIRYSEDGFEETFAVNHLAHFYLFQLLQQKFDTLKQVFIISSNLHSPELSKGFAVAPDLSNLELLAYPETNETVTTDKQLKVFYPNSKLCNVLFGYELSKRYPNIICNSFNPGFMPSTGLPRNNSALSQWILKNILSVFTKFSNSIRTPQKSAEDIYYNITNSKIGGKYIDGKKIITSSLMNYDENLSKSLWDFSKKLVNKKINDV